MTSTARRFLALAVAAIGLAVAAVVVFQGQLPDQVEEVPIGAWSIFFGLNGFVFAILVGLLIAELMRRFARLNGVVRTEASALAQVKRAMVFHEGDDAIEELLRADVRDYATAVLEVEWPEMAMKRRVPGEGGAMAELYTLLNEIRALEAEGGMDSIASRMLTDSAVEVSHLRAERLHLSAEQLSPIIRLLVGFLSFVIVLGFTMLNVGSLSIHISMVVLLTGAVLLLNLGLNDLSWPFVGIWNVSPDPFRELTRVLKVPLRDTERVTSLAEPLAR